MAGRKAGGKNRPKEVIEAEKAAKAKRKGILGRPRTRPARETQRKPRDVSLKAARAAQARRQADKDASTLHRAQGPDQLLVDARLETVGEATEPKPLPPERPVPKRGSKYRACEKCHLVKAGSKYSMIQAAKNGSPRVDDNVCMACRAEEAAADLKAQVLERAAQRRAGELTKQVIEGRARSRSHQQLEANKRRGEAKKATTDEKVISSHAQRELARRELARRHLLYFTRRFEGQQVDEEGNLVDIERAKGKGYMAGWVHKDICARLERFFADVRAGKQPRLMLFMPPRHGKSTLASRMFPAWVLGQDPTFEVIAASYGSSLPEQFSRNVRGILRDVEYQAIFPGTRLDPERENVQGWATTGNGLYIPAGVGSGISGKGADLLIIDDPFKGAEDAENPLQREKVVDWYFSEAFTRLSPNAGVLIICTRWHDADLAGSLLASQDEQQKESEEIRDSELAEIEEAQLSEPVARAARQSVEDEHKERMEDVERWEVVSFAAIADADEYRMPNGRIVNEALEGGELLRKEGEALHSSRYPLSRLRKIKKGLFARMRQRFWYALYQQKPVPDEGIHFSREMVRLEPHPGVNTMLGWLGVTAWDLAAGQKRQHDFTVGAHGKMDFEGVIHVLQLTRGRFKGAHGVATEVLDDYERNAPQIIGIEKGPLEGFLMPGVSVELEARNKERGYKDRLTPVFAEGEFALAPIQDPVLRAGPLQSVMQQNKMVFSKDLKWLEDAIAELIRFPGGVHDDIVTALSWLVRLTLKFQIPKRPTIKQRQRSWKNKLAKYTKNVASGHMAA